MSIHTADKKNKAPKGTAPMFALSAMDEDGLSEQHRNQHQLDSMLHALPPSASFMPSTFVEEQPLPHTVSIPRIVPIARIDDVPHIPSSPVHGLNTVANINVANCCVVVDRG